MPLYAVIFRVDNYQLSPTNPDDNLLHAQSPVMLYTKLDAECGQQVMVIG